MGYPNTRTEMLNSWPDAFWDGPTHAEQAKSAAILRAARNGTPMTGLSQGDTIPAHTPPVAPPSVAPDMPTYNAAGDFDPMTPPNLPPPRSSAAAPSVASGTRPDAQTPTYNAAGDYDPMMSALPPADMSRSSDSTTLGQFGDSLKSVGNTIANVWNGKDGAMPRRADQLPDGVARHPDIDGNRIYMSRGPHGEPVYSTSVEGTMNVDPRAGMGGAGGEEYGNDSPQARTAAAVRTLQQQSDSGMPGGTINPSSFRQEPVAPPPPLFDPKAAKRTDAAVAAARSKPGGDTIAPPRVLDPATTAGHPQGSYNWVAANQSAAAKGDETAKQALQDFQYSQGRFGAAGMHDPTGYAAEQRARAMQAQGLGAGMGGGNVMDLIKLQEGARHNVAGEAVTAARFNRDQTNDKQKLADDAVAKEAEAVKDSKELSPEEKGDAAALRAYMNNPVLLEGTSHATRALGVARRSFSRMTGADYPGPMNRLGGLSDSQIDPAEFHVQRHFFTPDELTSSGYKPNPDLSAAHDTPYVTTGKEPEPGEPTYHSESFYAHPGNFEKYFFGGDATKLNSTIDAFRRGRAAREAIRRSQGQ